MGTLVSNVSKGKPIAYYEAIKADANQRFVVLLLKVAESDALLIDRLTLAELLANNTECDFTNYARKYFVGADLAALPAPDLPSDRRVFTLPDYVMATSGGTINNSLAKMVLCYDDDLALSTDTTIVPVGVLDAAGTTSGSDINVGWNVLGVFEAR